MGVSWLGGEERSQPWSSRIIRVGVPREGVDREEVVVRLWEACDGIIDGDRV